MSEQNGYVKAEYNDSVCTITFFHPKGNSLPSNLLYSLAEEIEKAGKADNVRSVVLKSEGTGAYCAGASFDELVSIDNFENGKRFFMGFATVINAMRKCPKFIITRVHGKIVGGGVGLVSASDYSIATKEASVRLSELALSIGPFVIGPAVERKIGIAEYSSMTIDYEWRSADWAKSAGLYSKVVNNREELDKEIDSLVSNHSKLNPETIADLKKCFWHGTEDWDKLLEERAEMSGKLVISEFTKNYLHNFLANRKNGKA